MAGKLWNNISKHKEYDMHDIKIKPASNGWIVKIGCQTFVAEHKDHMIKEVSRYIDNPCEVEKEYMEKAKNKGILPVADATVAETRLTTHH